MTLDPLSQPAKQAGDVVSLGVVFATIADWFPAVTALLTIVWTAIRIWETPTVQRIVGRKAETETET
jgi:hypothetical protein